MSPSNSYLKNKTPKISRQVIVNLANLSDRGETGEQGERPNSPHFAGADVVGALRNMLMDSVKKANDDVEAGLQRIVDDPSQNQEARNFAQDLLSSIKKFCSGVVGKISTFCSSQCIWNCICVTFEKPMLRIREAYNHIISISSSNLSAVVTFCLFAA
jgi:hypothetical protein